jgi:peroxiredoxin
MMNRNDFELDDPVADLMMTGKRPEIGSKAFDFVLPDGSDNMVRLSDLYREAPVLLLFYTSDFGMLCSVQMSEVRDNYERFGALGVQVVGLSTNTQYSHATWSSTMRIPFRLLSDVDGEAAAKYGMMCPSDSFLKGRTCRSAVLIDREGRITWAWVPADTHITPDIEELLSDLAKVLGK